MMIRFLDKNSDGTLQSSELPERLRVALLPRLDKDGNKALDPSELQILQDWLESLKASRDA
jgi:hypothetical protein